MSDCALEIRCQSIDFRAVSLGMMGREGYAVVKAPLRMAGDCSSGLAPVLTGKIGY